MIANLTTRAHTGTIEAKAPTSFGTRPSLVSRVARRNFCHVHEVPLGSNPKSSVFASRAQLNAQPHNEHPRVRVAGFPSSNRNCCHQLFAEHGAQLKRVDLASTRRVEVRQRFRAEAGDELSFDCAVLLKAGRGFGLSGSVQVVAVNLKTHNAHVLLDRTIEGGRDCGPRRIDAKSRERRSLSIWAAGEYELRTITSIDPTSTGAEAHVLIDTVRITDSLGAETKRLASLSCVGRVA